MKSPLEMVDHYDYQEARLGARGGQVDARLLVRPDEEGYT
jgi:hypothetical protein